MLSSFALLHCEIIADYMKQVLQAPVCQKAGLEAMRLVSALVVQLMLSALDADHH